MSQQLAKLITPDVAAFAIALVLICGCACAARAQTDDAFGDGSADPVKLFERGQNAHARNDLIKALEFYEEAIKVRPEFAEAEFQRGNVLVGLGRFQEAESAFRRTLELRKDWSLPYSALGALLVRLNRDSDAEPLLRQAIQTRRAKQPGAPHVGRHSSASRATQKKRLNWPDAPPAIKDAPASTWILRALAERAAGDKVAALAISGSFTCNWSRTMFRHFWNERRFV